MPLAAGKQLVVRGIPSVAELHDRDHLVAPTFRWAPGHDDVVHVRMLGHRGLHFLGEDLLATGVDGDGVAPEQLDAAVREEAGPISGYRPTHVVDGRES